MARPPKYRKEYCDALIEHMGKGGSMVAFCASAGICRDTFFEWTRRHKEFSDTYKKGLELCEAHWEEVGRQAMTGGGKTFNTALYCFYMKNRFHWRDAAAPEAAPPEKAGGGNTLVDVKNLILVNAGQSAEARERIVRGLEAAVLENKNHKG